MQFTASPIWRTTYSGAMIGVLAMNAVANPSRQADLEARKLDLEARLRDRYSSSAKAELRSHPVLRAYAAYYKTFGKTYHVQLQLESIIYKGKSVPSVAALVEAMFIAELDDMLLTAGHDLDALQGDPAVDVATGAEEYVLMNSQPQMLKQGDMFIHDEAGILSSIIYGPAARARVTPETQRVLFTVYAPDGIGLQRVKAHLERLQEYARIIRPQANVEYDEVVR